MDRLSVSEAAAALGVSQAAVYKRIQRGTIEHDKDIEGRVFVYLDTSDIGSDKSVDASMDGATRDELIAELRTQNEYLRQEVADWKEEARRKDHLLAAALERIPAIEPPEEPPSELPEGHEKATEEPSGTQAPLEQEKPPGQRSWLRRLFLGS